MNTTQTAEREKLYQRILELLDEKAGLVERYVSDLEGRVPNEETIRVLKDSEAGRNVVGPFHNMNDFMKSLLDDDDA